MQQIEMQDLYKVIIGLVVILVFSWSLFSWIVKRWVMATDDKLRELYNSRNAANIAIAERATICNERHK